MNPALDPFRPLVRIVADRVTGGSMGWARVFIAVFAAPVLMTLATLLFAATSALFVVRSDVTVGTVVQVYEWPGETPFDRGRTNYEPIFTYLEDDEERRASVGSSHAAFKIAEGETAEIRYIPGERGNVRMNIWQGLWFMPVALAGFAAAFWIIAIVLWFGLRVVFHRKDT